MESPGDTQLIRVCLNRETVLKDTAQVVIYDRPKMKAMASRNQREHGG